MKTARPFVSMLLVGFLALSGVSTSFGQNVPVPAAPALPADPQPDAPAVGAAPQGAQPVQAAGAIPVPAAGAVQPDPGALPTVGSLPPDPSLAAAAPVLPQTPQPLPAAGGIAVGSPVAPLTTVQDLSVTLGSQMIGSSAFLAGGGRIGTVQDLMAVGGLEYLLVSYRRQLVSIPRSLTTFDPGRRLCLVRLTGAQFGGLPVIPRLSQFNDRRFVQQFDAFFRGPRGQALFRNGFARDTRGNRNGQQNGDRRRAETRTAGKPIFPRQDRTDERFPNGNR